MNTDSWLEQHYRGKTVLITGHTGFKGSWLSIWLDSMGAKVIGLSNDIPTTPSHFAEAGLSSLVEDHRGELADAATVRRVIEENRPDFVFHLAAQALVLESYRDPLTTFSTNIMGTAHVLDALRRSAHPCQVVMITSDKCYDNVEWVWGYREDDRLGGKDPYSASKGGAELVIRSYFESWLRDSDVRLGIARAGNVIGGGDWAADRLVPDCIRAWSAKEPVTIKNPNTTRPWQLVLEPLSGYLALGALLGSRDALNGEAFNFGPLAESNYSVGQLLAAMQAHWPGAESRYQEAMTDAVYEAGLLKLNCDKALHLLDWRPTYGFDDTVHETVGWYQRWLKTPDDPEVILSTSRQQIADYVAAAKSAGLRWSA